MRSNHSKYMEYSRRDGEIHIQIIDGNFNTIYDNKVGLLDRKGLTRLKLDMKNKGAALLFQIDVEKGMEDFW